MKTKGTPPGALLLGIDTGGTYTDGVLVDDRTRSVLASTKTLTTRHDLGECILKALDALLPDDPGRISLVSISTTLATNAIAEGRRRPVALFLLGYDPALVRRFQFEGNFATGSFHYFQGGHDLGGQEQAPLDEQAIVARARELADQVEAFAISGYFSPFNAEHETRAMHAVRNATGMPVVLGSQLSSKLDSIQRAATASLNASLLSILQEFLAAMRAALDERGVRAPLMVVRGDGALVGDRAAEARPVETVHSGPAASAIGGRTLSGRDPALVIDIGGTTTDLAVVQDGRVPVSEQGTSVGPYRTAVRAARVRSIGLGGDSLVGFGQQRLLTVGPERVTPISALAARDARVAADLGRLFERGGRRLSPATLEYWFLQREPRRPLADGRAQAAVDLLRRGPVALPDLLERLELYHPLQFGGSALLNQEIAGRAALTPTDLLHVSGEYAPYDAGAAATAARFMARLGGMEVGELVEAVHRHIAERIAAEVVAFLSGRRVARAPDFVAPDDLGAWLFEENLGGADPYLGAALALKIPIVGIGAPARIYLPRVAGLLHAELVVPEHYQVANAVGAVAGSVVAEAEAWIVPHRRGPHTVGFHVQASGEREQLETLEAAVERARALVAEQALQGARASGAREAHVQIEQVSEGVESYRLRARAVGSPQAGSGEA